MLVTAGRPLTGERPTSAAAGRDPGAHADLRLAAVPQPPDRRVLHDLPTAATPAPHAFRMGEAVRSTGRSGLARRQPPKLDPVLNGQRNIFERAIARSNSAGDRNRYDKPAANYHTWLVLAALSFRGPHEQSDTP